MNTKELFFRVRERHPIEQADFLGALGDCVRALLARYPTALLTAEGDGSIGAPGGLEESCGLHPLYDSALILGCLAAAGADGVTQNDFLREAELAYRSRWRECAKGKRIAPRGRW